MSGSVHAHGAYDVMMDVNNFSDEVRDDDGNVIGGDKYSYRKLNIPGYVTTPNGSLFLFLPEMNQTFKLPVDLPADDNDPSICPGDKEIIETPLSIINAGG